MNRALAALVAVLLFARRSNGGTRKPPTSLPPQPPPTLPPPGTPITSVTARPIVAAAWRAVYGRDGTLAELQAIQGIARLETGYATGWGTPEGRASHNWGAIQALPDDPNSFAATDTHPTSSGGAVKYQARFKVYPDDVAGAAAIARWLRSHGVPDAVVGGGNAWALSSAMHAAHYYEGSGRTVQERIANHRRRFLDNVRALAGKLGEPVAWQ